MFSSPTESSTKARRRNSHADGPTSSNLATGSTRRLTSRQSSATTGPPTDDCPIMTTAPLSGRAPDRSIKWHWVQQTGDPLPKGRRFHSSVTIGSDVFVFGGEQRAEDSHEQRNAPEKKKVLLNDLVVFDAVQQIWRTVIPSGKAEDLPKPRKGHSLTVWGNKIVLFGGAGNQTYLNDLWIYDTQLQTSPSLSTNSVAAAGSTAGRSPPLDSSPKSSPASTGRWRQIHAVVTLRTAEEQQFFGGSVPNGPHPRAYHTAVIHQDFLYVYGGYGFSSQTPDVDVWQLDLHTHEWTPINSPAHSIKPGRRYGHVACCFDNSMFIFGGQVRSCLNDSDIYRFNFVTHEWTLSPMRRTSTRRSGSATPNSRSLVLTGAPCPRTYHSAALLESHGRWLIHGGSNEDQTFGDLHEFNIRNERWRSVACPTPVLLEGHTLAIAPTGISYSLLSIGGSASLASQALRLDILTPSINASQWKLEELIVPAAVVPPFLEYIRETSGMLSEVNVLRQAQRSVQEDRRNRRALVEKLSAENEDLRLQLQEVAKKLELSLRETSTRFADGENTEITVASNQSSDSSALKIQLNEKQKEIDRLMDELLRMQESTRKSDQEKSSYRSSLKEIEALEWKLNQISETMKHLRENATTIVTASSCGMPAETVVKVVSMASNLILQSVDQMQDKFLSNSDHQNSNLQRSSASTTVSTNRPSAEQLSLKRLPTRSEIENEQNQPPKSSGRRSSQHSSRHLTPRQSETNTPLSPSNATTPDSVSPRLIRPGVDIGLQAGKGKIKLFRSFRKRSNNNPDKSKQTSKSVKLSITTTAS